MKKVFDFVPDLLARVENQQLNAIPGDLRHRFINRGHHAIECGDELVALLTVRTAGERGLWR